MEADKAIAFIWFSAGKALRDDNELFSPLGLYETVEIMKIPIKGINNKRISNIIMYFKVKIAYLPLVTWLLLRAIAKYVKPSIFTIYLELA